MADDEAPKSYFDDRRSEEIIGESWADPVEDDVRMTLAMRHVERCPVCDHPTGSCTHQGAAP